MRHGNDFRLIWCQSLNKILRHSIDIMLIWCQSFKRTFRHENDMPGYIGRAQEREEFRRILAKKKASLVTCQGRRRIGKSRFIAECAVEADHYLSFSGLAPREGMTRQQQLHAFTESLVEQTRVPRVHLDAWPAALQLLASQLPQQGSVIVLLDEISWMAAGDADFAGHLKAAWDAHFSKHPHLVLVLCGSVSSWIEANILRSTGFVGRCSWQFRLQPLPLPDCAQFWGRRGARISAAEKLRLLSVTGGVPRYLEEIDPARTAEENIHDWCFNPGGMLFREFDDIFHDLFTRKAGTYREITRTLVEGPRSLDQISTALGRERGGSLGTALEDLELAGFLSKDIPFDPSTGRSRPREARLRLSDNYLRFFLKYIDPLRERIEKGLFRTTALENLEGWESILGLQLENLVLANLDALLPHLKLERTPVLNAAPYAQRQTQRRKGCQIDLLLRTKRSLYVVEIKFRQNIPASVADEVMEKVVRLKLPPNQSMRTALVYAGKLASELEESDAFDFLIPIERLFERS